MKGMQKLALLFLALALSACASNDPIGNYSRTSTVSDVLSSVIFGSVP